METLKHNSSFFFVNKKLAKEIGYREALLIGILVDNLDCLSLHFHDYPFNFIEDLTGFSKYKQKKMIAYLESKKLLVSKNENNGLEIMLDFKEIDKLLKK
jgi:hypothetical protein